MISPATQVGVPEDVLVQQIEGQSALLHLASEQYFGLDEVGTRMWEALGAAGTVGAALDALAEVYDADREEIERDLLALVEQLVERGLLEIRA